MSVLWFDGLLAQARDAGVYFLPADDVDELLEAAAVNRFRCVRVGLEACDSEAGALAAVGSGLQLDAAAAAQAAALADAVGDLRGPHTRGLVLLLEGSGALRDDDLPGFKSLMEALQAASGRWAERGMPFWTFVTLPETEFDAL